MKTDKMENRKQRKSNRKRYSLLLSLALIVTVLVSAAATMAYLAETTDAVKNTFTPVQVSCEVEEEFDGEEKSSITVKNTSDTKAFLRVNLVSYRINADGDRIGGTAEIADVELADGWFEQDGFYYYSQALEAGESTPNMLKAAIVLQEYDDADGGKQVIEVMAEAIQAGGGNDAGAPAEQAWNVTVNGDTIAKGGN